MLTTLLHILLAALALWLISGTLLNLTKHPHWYIRGWDFPRTIVAGIAAVVLLPYAALFHDHWHDRLAIGGLVFVIARQLYMIFPYTPLARKAVKGAAVGGDHPARSFRLLMSNVLEENTRHDLWLRVVRAADPDVIVAVEVDGEWDEALASGLGGSYPHVLRKPQGNYYGMAIYSRLPFEGEPEVRFLVQDDIPSAHITLRLRDGQRVRLHALHPRPPEPLRDQDSAPRDAELVLMGKEIAEHERDVPTVVCGDLNDVAWSYTTQLFLRLSRLLDPRRGRGFYNSFNAESRLFRFPLDHVFHSNEFKLVDLRVLPYVGSDHFPVLIELSCEPEAARQAQPESTPTAADHENAAEIVATQAAGGERGGGGS
jgi:endonuclease/exonuclease/phosphatase (EEP) superfamily protein YafD